MRAGIEAKRNWLRDRLGWRLNVDALSDDEVRHVYTHERMHELANADPTPTGLFNAICDAVIEDALEDENVTPCHVELHPFNPDLITVVFVEQGDG